MLYSDEEINIVGIIPENDIQGQTTPQELRKIIYDALSIGPIYEPLLLDLESKNHVDAGGEI